MADRGRPDKFTEKRRNRIFELLKDGLSYESIAAGSGISKALFYRWLQEAREVRDNVENNDLDIETLDQKSKDLLDYLEQFELVETEMLREVLNDIKKSDKKWFITRRFRQQYEDVQNVNINAKVETSMSWKDMVEKAKESE